MKLLTKDIYLPFLTLFMLNLGHQLDLLWRWKIPLPIIGVSGRKCQTGQSTLQNLNTQVVAWMCRPVCNWGMLAMRLSLFAPSIWTDLSCLCFCFNGTSIHNWKLVVLLALGGLKIQVLVCLKSSVLKVKLTRMTTFFTMMSLLFRCFQRSFHSLQLFIIFPSL